MDLPRYLDWWPSHLSLIIFDIATFCPLTYNSTLRPHFGLSFSTYTVIPYQNSLVETYAPGTGISKLIHFIGPRLRAAFIFPDALSILSGRAFLDTKRLHERYGKVVRTSPNALSFITAEAWKGKLCSVKKENQSSKLLPTDIYNLKPDRSENAKDPSFYQADGNLLSRSSRARIHSHSNH